MLSGKEAQPSQGNAPELRHFLGAEEGIKAPSTHAKHVLCCELYPRPVDICLHRSGNTLVSCSASFNGQWQQSLGGSDHHSLVLSAFYLPIKAPTSSRCLSVQPTKRHLAYRLSLQSTFTLPCLRPSLCTTCLRNAGRKASGKAEEEMGDDLFQAIGYSPGNPLTPYVRDEAIKQSG